MATNKIRVGLIGLNAPYTTTPTGTNWAADAHLPYLKKSTRYEIVALQNSSVEKAMSAIRAYDLDPTKVKAYGNPEEVANDPNIDLVVSSIRVDRHAGSLIPSIKAGKSVYVEWPIEANYALAKELADLVKVHNVKNVVGLQGSFSPVIAKAKALIKGGEIGKIESSSMVALARNVSGGAVLSPVDYFIDKKVGGNLSTIAFGHSVGLITSVLGDISSHSSLLVNQYPYVDVVDATTKNITSPGRPSDVPNQIILNGILASGAVFVLKVSAIAGINPGGKPQEYKRALPGLDWRIHGSKGELRISCYASWSLSVENKDLKLEIVKADDGELKEVDIDEDKWENGRVGNIARVYEAFGTADKGEEKTEWYPDFEHALKIHKLIDQMYTENGV